MSEGIKINLVETMRGEPGVKRQKRALLEM